MHLGSIENTRWYKKFLLFVEQIVVKLDIMEIVPRRPKKIDLTPLWYSTHNRYVNGFKIFIDRMVFYNITTLLFYINSVGTLYLLMLAGPGG